MLKIDLHMHSSEDPRDALDYDARALIRQAAQLDFDAIAITLHGRVLFDEDLRCYASSRGVLLIPGIEKRIHGREVLVFNVTQPEMDAVHSFQDLRELKLRRRESILIVAPHPFFKNSQCLGRHLEENIDLFDAIEYCHLYTRLWNWNKRAVEVAERNGKTLVATSDAHALWMFGNNYTWVEAPATTEGIFDAIRKGRVKPHSEPIPPLKLVEKLGWFFVYHKIRKAMRLVKGDANAALPSRGARVAEPTLAK